jgi:hypothetical protein
MRTPPHAASHTESLRKGDRIATKPRTLRALLHWGQSAYALEPPPRLHDRDIADDGAPDHTPEAKRYFGLAKRGEAPDDWRAIACRTDVDGFYETPLRCALERVPGDERRALLRAVLPDVFTPRAAATSTGIPEWCAEDVLFRALSLLWDRYSDRPLPRRGKSDAQLDAEAA